MKPNEYVYIETPDDQKIVNKAGKLLEHLSHPDQSGETLWRVLVYCVGVEPYEQIYPESWLELPFQQPVFNLGETVYLTTSDFCFSGPVKDIQLTRFTGYLYKVEVELEGEQKDTWTLPEQYLFCVRNDTTERYVRNKKQ